MKEGFEEMTSVIEKDLASEFKGRFSAGIDAARKENVMAKKKAELLDLQGEKIEKFKRDLDEKKVGKASDYTISTIDTGGLSKDEAKEITFLKDRINKAILKIGEPKKADDAEKAKAAKKTPNTVKDKPIEDETAKPSAESVANDNEVLSVKADSPFALDADGSMTTLGEAGFKKIEEDETKKGDDGDFIDVESRMVEKEGISGNGEKVEKKFDFVKMESELADARRDFAEMDHKKKGAWEKLKAFFGKSLESSKVEKEIEGKPGEKATVFADDDVSYMEALYLNKLRDYKNAKFEELKEKGLSGKELDGELENIGKFVTVMERAELFGAQTDIKIENKQGTLFGKMQSLWVSGVESYRSMPMKKKLLFSATLMFGGFISTGIGAPMAAAAFMGGRTLVRLMGTAVFSNEIAKRNRAKLENLNVENLGKEGEREVEKLLQATEQFSDQERIVNYQKALDESLFAADEKLQERKTKSAWMTAQSIAVGIAAGALMYNFKNILDYTGISDKFSDLFGGGGSAPEQVSNLVHLPDAEITVNSGSSIEKSLIEYLKANHLADIDNPGEAAHVMVQDYAKAHGIPYEKLNHILPGTHFTVDPNTHQIVNMDVKFMAENEHLSSVVAQEVPIEESDKIVEENLLNIDNGDIVENSQSVEQLQKGVAELDAKYRTEIGEMSSAADGVDEVSHRDMVNEIDKDREILKQQLMDESGFADKLKTEAFGMRKELANGNPSTWNEIKNLNYQQASSEPEIRSKLEKLAKLYRKDIGPNGIEPRNGEKLEHWTWRVAGSALKRRLKIEHE